MWPATGGRPLDRLGWLLALALLAACEEGEAGVAAAASTEPPATREARPLTFLAFGSCADQRRPQPVWDTIVATEPQLFLSLGDAIYATGPRPRELIEGYRTLRLHQGFQRLRASCPVLAVWDDHDYGIEDGGAEHPRREVAQELFLTFFDEPADSPRWDREGLYGRWTLGPPGRRVQVVMLDVRSHRTPLRPWPLVRRGMYLPTEDEEATMLGAAQWAWLEDVLAEPAELRLLCSPTQVVPDNHPFEKWANMPAERERLLALLEGVDGVVLLTGDQHLGELSLLPREGTYDLLEVSASGLTHTRRGLPGPNRHRLGEAVTDVHFGTVEIDWTSDDPSVAFSIVDVDGVTRLGCVLSLSDLRRGGAGAR